MKTEVRAYCPECNDLVRLNIGERMETREFHGETITFLAKYAECPTCHQEFLIPETHDVNLAYLQNEYRHRRRYLSPDEIVAVRKKYGLSARSFARILGLGDISITRYEKGAIPDEAQHNLIMLANNPENFSALFERNRERLSEEEQQRVSSILQQAKVVVVWQSWSEVSTKAESTEYMATSDFNNCLECMTA